MKKTVRLLGWGLLSLVVVIVLLQVGWYQIDGQPLPVADEYLVGPGFSSQQAENGDWSFVPDHPNGRGVVILHGALIKPKSYSKTAAFFASRGFKVWVPYGTLRLSIFAASRIATQLAAMPEQQWFLIGHSMGGFTALTVNNETEANILAVAIWAGSMPEDFSGVIRPLLFVSGTNEGLLPAERYASLKQHLPQHTVYEVIEGANHKNFALYSHQFFDEEASLPHMHQVDRANAMTFDFFQAYIGSASP
jgi:pimeloyl-ACP methyl ester carboxylesterase